MRVIRYLGERLHITLGMRGQRVDLLWVAERQLPSQPCLLCEYLPAAFEIARWSSATVSFAEGMYLAVALHVFVYMSPPCRAQ